MWNSWLTVCGTVVGTVDAQLVGQLVLTVGGTVGETVGGTVVGTVDEQLVHKIGDPETSGYVCWCVTPLNKSRAIPM